MSAPSTAEEGAEVAETADTAALAAVGGLAGDELAAHLGVASLEEHAASFVRPDDHPDRFPDYLRPDEATLAFRAWLDAPAYTGAMQVGDKLYSECGWCGQIVGRTEAHTEAHRRLGA